MGYVYSYRIYSHQNELGAINNLNKEFSEFLNYLNSDILQLSDFLPYDSNNFLPDIIKKQYKQIDTINKNMIEPNKEIYIEIEAKELVNE